MPGVFKSLDASDVSLVPFRAYKQFQGSDSYVTYSAVLNTRVADGKEDIGNNAYSGSEFVTLTTNDKSANSVWHSIDSQFYRYYYSNPKASFGPLAHAYQPRYLSNKALVISIPQKNFGEQIEPGSVQITIDGRDYIDDLYGNLYYDDRWLTGGNQYQISASNIVFGLKSPSYTYRFGEVINETVEPGADLYQASVTFNNVRVTASQYQTELFVDSALYDTSSIVITPNGEDVSKMFNFTNRDYIIALSFIKKSNDTCVLLQKSQTTAEPKVDANGEIYYQQVTRYPYKFTYDGSTVTFTKSNGLDTVTGTVSYTGTGQPLYLIRSGSQFRFVNTSGIGTLFTDTLYDDDVHCANTAPIHLGADENGNNAASGSFGHVFFINDSFDYRAAQAMSRAAVGGRMNPYQTVGNVFRDQGLIVITDKGLVGQIESSGITSLEYRGTTTIYENNVSCTVTPGEFKMSFNPTAHEYDPAVEQFKLAGFATSSDFRPFVTRIGLYNDQGELMVIGSLSQPIQMPNNVDTTFVLRYDT